MVSADREKESDVMALMTKSFSMTESSAYPAFIARRLKCDESVDAFVANLKRLCELSGHTVVDDEDSVVIQQLLAGLPPDYNRQVRLSLVGKRTTISDCVGIVRALRTSDLDSASWNVAAAATSDSSTRNHVTGTSSSNVHSSKSVLCFRCRETGHMWRHCPKVKSGGGSHSAKNHFKSGRLTCFFCDGQGHWKVDCPERKAWLAKKGVNAAATGSAEDPCLRSVAIPGQLPRIYVDVSSAATNSSTRARAVLDTGSTRTLISEQFATEHSIRVVASKSAPMNDS